MRDRAAQESTPEIPGSPPRHPTPPQDLRAHGLRASGELATRLGDFGLAAERCQASLALYRDLADRSGMARALRTLGANAWEQSQFERAAELCSESLQVWRELGDRGEMAYALHGLAMCVAPLGDRSRALALYQEALTIWQSQGQREAIATTLLNIAVLLRLEGDVERSRALLEEARVTCRELGDVTREASVLHALGSVAWASGHRDEAGGCFRESLRIRLGVGARSRIAGSLEGVAATAVDAVLAARLLGFADAVREAARSPRHPENQPMYEQAMAELRGTLGEEPLRREMEVGRALSLQEACAMALG
jgi:tetratricopeptide (TPR) repeat protein